MADHNNFDLTLADKMMLEQPAVFANFGIGELLNINLTTAGFVMFHWTDEEGAHFTPKFVLSKEMLTQMLNELQNLAPKVDFIAGVTAVVSEAGGRQRN